LLGRGDIVLYSKHAHLLVAGSCMSHADHGIACIQMAGTIQT
jgi:hypothetical protein